MISKTIPPESPITQATAKDLVCLRTNIAAVKAVFSTNTITLPMAAISLEMPFAIELKRTPKSISSLSVFFGVELLIILSFMSLLKAKRKLLGFILC